MFSPDHFHPMLVHFPIALLIVGFLIDVAAEIFKKEKYLHQMGFILQILGTLGAIAAFITGDNFTNWETFQGATKAAFELHQNAAILALWTAIAATIVRILIIMMQRFSGWTKWLTLLLYFAAVVAIGYTGLMGGNLVLNFLMGI
jgi:uncharacterized membrane protein